MKLSFINDEIYWRKLRRNYASRRYGDSLLHFIHQQNNIVDSQWSIDGDVVYLMTIASYPSRWNRWNGRAIYFEIAASPRYWPRSVIRINPQYCSLSDSVNRPIIKQKSKRQFVRAFARNSIVERDIPLKSETLMKQPRIDNPSIEYTDKKGDGWRTRAFIQYYTRETREDKDSHLLPRHDQSQWWIRLITFAAQRTIVLFSTLSLACTDINVRLFCS